MNDRLGQAFGWPEPVSSFAPASDALAAQLAWSGAAFVIVLVVGLALAVARPWRARWPLAIWGVALVACLAPFARHAAVRTTARAAAPEDALTIHVRARRWRWEFEQPNGMTSGELMVPVDRPVRLRITTESNGEGEEPAIHGLSVPALRIAADVIPGRVTEVSFEARRTGEYQIYCSGFCGTGHSRMLSTVHVLTAEQYDSPSTCQLGMPPDGMSLAEWGRGLFVSTGCPACHDVEPGSRALHGPSLTNVAGYDRQLEDGSTVVADAGYLIRAIRRPHDEIVAGYDAARMPAFELPQVQLDALVTYLASISDRGDRVATPSE